MNAATTEANFFRRFLHRSVPLYKAHLSIYDRVPTWSRSCHVYKSTLLWRIRRRMVVLFGGKDRVESVISLIRVSTLTEQRLSAWYQYLVTIWRRDTYRIVEGKSIHARISTKESWSSRLDHVEDEHSQAGFLTRLSLQASTVCFSNCQRKKTFRFWDCEIHYSTKSSKTRRKGCFLHHFAAFFSQKKLRFGWNTPQSGEHLPRHSVGLWVCTKVRCKSTQAYVIYTALVP